MLLALCLGPALDFAIQAAIAQPLPSPRRPCRVRRRGAKRPAAGPHTGGRPHPGIGQLARLAGIRLPDARPHREQALSWLKARSGEPVLVQGTDRHDRWDRISVRIQSSGGPAARLGPWIGRGRPRPGRCGLDDVFCQPELLALEATARERRLGVWADDRYKPLDANQSERLRERVGSFVLVEGRVRSIGERKQRIYLNFGGLWAEDFTIIIPRTTWKQMLDRGLGAEALKGRRIRARGILQPWQGTAFSIGMPDMIERLEGDRLAR